MKNYILILLLFLTTNLLTAQSNLFLDDSFTVEEMIEDFFNTPNVSVSNITYTGSPDAISFFDAGGTGLAVGAGILISSGATASIAEENGDFANNASTSFGTPGDEDIEMLIANGFISNDAAVIEFDFTVVNTDSLNFKYVFGSEEYPEFVCSFNDAFGFFISGPGIMGPYSNNAINISTIPDTESVVSINNVNDILECGDPANEIYYIDNSTSQHINFDGLTTSLPSSFQAVGGETYHAKIVVADVSDNIYDSGVFLSFEGLGSDNLLIPEAEFLITQNTNAVNFDNLAKYARSWNWDFGNNQTSTDRNPGIIVYDQVGTYTVQLVTENFCCTDTFTIDIEITDIPEQIVVDEIVTPITCPDYNDATIELFIAGGTSPYNTNWEPNIADINNVMPGTYTYTITDINGIETTGTILIENAMAPDINVTTTPATGGQADGTAAANASNGTPPYQYLWSTGATTPFIENLAVGEYTVEVTDGNGCSFTESFSINLQSFLVEVNTTDPTCFGYDDGIIEFNALGGTAPYNYLLNPDIGNGISAGTYNYTITDANGLINEGSVTLDQPEEIIVVVSSLPTTENNQNGTANAIISNGGILPFQFEWSNGATTSVIGNLAPGEYTVTVTDATGCESIVSTIVESSTNVNEVNDNSFLNLFPNPVDHTLFIENNSDKNLQDLKLFSMLGQQHSIDFEIDSSIIKVNDVEKLPQGVYILQFRWEEDQISTMRFVKK